MRGQVPPVMKTPRRRNEDGDSLHTSNDIDRIRRRPSATPYRPTSGSAALASPRPATTWRAGAEELVAAETVAELKGRDMMVGRFAELLGLST